MKDVSNQHRVLAWVFAVLTVVAMLMGAYAFTQQSQLVIILALVPLFGVLALAFAFSTRRD